MNFIDAILDVAEKAIHAGEKECARDALAAITRCEERTSQHRLKYNDLTQAYNRLAEEAKLLKYAVIATDGRFYTVFYAVFDREPTQNDIIDAQRKAGYAPEGYGGPCRLHLTGCTGCVVATWTCSGSCD